jgi:hypothetical protein
MSHLDVDNCSVVVQAFEPQRVRGLCGHIWRSGVLEYMGHCHSISDYTTVLNCIFGQRYQAHEVAEVGRGRMIGHMAESSSKLMDVTVVYLGTQEGRHIPRAWHDHSGGGGGGARGTQEGEVVEQRGQRK